MHDVLALWSWNVSVKQLRQVLPLLSLNLPLSQAWHVVAPGVLDVPEGQSSHNSSGVGLPFVPAGHAVNPDKAVASILDPSGTTTEEDPPLATIDPALTGIHFDCSGSVCKYPVGHPLHSTLFSWLANVPGEQGMQETEPVVLVYVPFEQGVWGAFVPAQVYPRWQTVWTPSNMYDPGGTALQPVDPLPELSHPLGQSSQVVLPAVVWNVPTKQSWHVALPPLPALPAGQITSVVGPDW
jgi:hypothetical protein